LPNLAPKTSNGPTRLYVGSLHFNITEDMLRGIFEPFGKIDHIQLMTDPETGKSKGYGFLTVCCIIYLLQFYLQFLPSTNARGLYSHN
jgi:RNA recognition motif-containing protein